MKILAGDIGGTKTILQIADYRESGFSILAEQRFDSHAYSAFEHVVNAFFRECGALSAAIDAACVGVAGPVRKRQAQVTNLHWMLAGDALANEFNIPRFYLINDFQAAGYGIELLQSNDLISLQTGQPARRGVRAVIGAGTGIGQAIMVWRDDINGYQVLASEGGHSSFAPVNAIQRELLQYLSDKFECVSLEHVASGQGIENIFHFFCETQGSGLTAELAAATETREVTPLVVEYALQGKDPLAVQTLDLFIDAYGAAAGNLALTSLSTGGLYVAGGIAPRIAGKLREGHFLTAFRHKSKMRSLLETIPVTMINNDRVGLLGAANYAVKGAHLQSG